MGIFDRYSNMFDPYQGGWEHRKAEQEKLEREYERQGYRPEEQAPDPLLDEVNQSKMMDMPVPLIYGVQRLLMSQLNRHLT